MKLETFFEKFDLFADAPGAVAKMRELVLELSASGRFIPEIIERPVEEEMQLMGTVVDLIMGQAPTGDEYNREGCGTAFVKVGEFGPLYPREEVWTTNPLKFAKAGDVLVCVVGATVGKLNLAIDCAIGRSVAAIRPSWALDTKFLYYSLIPYTLRLRRNSRGSAQGVVGKAELNSVSLWVPNLEVQKRVVAKLDELMALCDRLEAEQKEREEKKNALTRASLARFAKTPTPVNLNFLFHKSYDITPADLRKTILTLAVQGKLVPQDLNDEPAIALFDRIAAHKALLSKEGNFSGSTSVEPMIDADMEYALPVNWSWVRLGEIMINRDGERIPVSKEERQTRAQIYDYYGASGVIDKIDKYLFDRPLLLIGEDGANLINRSTPIAFIARGKYWVNNHAHVLDGISEDLLRFIELHINAINLEKYITGSAQPKMNQAKMNSIPIALPPLAEQRRIVAKVDQLMALVDELEVQVAASRATGEKLLAALVAELTTLKKSPTTA